MNRPVTASVVIRKRVTAHIDGGSVILICRTHGQITSVAAHRDHEIDTYVRLIPK